MDLRVRWRYRGCRQEGSLLRHHFFLFLPLSYPFASSAPFIHPVLPRHPFGFPSSQWWHRRPWHWDPFGITPAVVLLAPLVVDFDGCSRRPLCTLALLTAGPGHGNLSQFFCAAQSGTDP